MENHGKKEFKVQQQTKMNPQDASDAGSGKITLKNWIWMRIQTVKVKKNLQILTMGRRQRLGAF